MRKFYTLILLSLLSLPAFSIDIPEYWLENDKVKGYFSEPEYKSNDYSYTYITKYCYMQPWNWKKLGTGERLDQPLPVPIKLASPLGVESTLYISESEDYADAYTMTIPAGVDSVSVFNLIPEKVYNYKVEYDNGGVITPAVSGQFKTRGHVRMLKIDGIFNVRDLGGWTGLGGHPIKYGKIIRGSRLNVNSSSTKIITADGITELRRLGIRSELDMRNTSNAPMASSSESRHSYLGSDIPIANIDNAYNSRISTFSDAPQSIQGVQQLINWLKQDKPVYLHCSVGADRTGTVAYLVGALCGMSEDALCRDFELTSFSGDSVDNEAAHGTWEVLVRQRTYVGRLDPCSQKDSYQFAAMVDKIKKFPGANLQRKVYYHLSTGASAKGGYLTDKISEADLDWLIKYLVDYVLVKSITTDGGATLTLEPGQTHALNAVVVPADATNKTLSYSSSDTLIAKVSDSGVITAIGGGTAKISVKADDYVKTITVNIPLIESYIPVVDTIRYDGKLYLLANNTNLIKNGSFEYGHHFLNWKAANEKDLTDKAFSVKKYENGDSVYIESKADGDSTSLKSLRTMWSIQKGKTYVFGYRVRNTSDGPITSHPNMATSLVTLKPELNGTGDDFAWDTPSPAPRRAGERPGMIDSLTFNYPSYDTKWTDVQYVFTNTDGHQYIQVWFTHLSQGGNNTCLDNFYLFELTETTGVQEITIPGYSDDKIYNLAGQVVTNPGKGVYIKNGKKYIVK